MSNDNNHGNADNIDNTDNKTAQQPGRLCSLPEFFTDAEGQPVSVVVPKIQRAFAQGRQRERAVRERFVNKLFEALEQNRPMELNFVYGSKTREGATPGACRLELLDGQQRVTTLSLLYWYLACAEHRALPSWLSQLTYETRTTTENFLNRLVTRSLDIGSRLPSEAIRRRQWYAAVSSSFDKDSSVRGMLAMLDAIHLRYRRYADTPGATPLFDRLSNLRFYQLDLRDFGLTEEVYIKMNARGLQLTPFENFKADLTGYMKDHPSQGFSNPVEMKPGGPKVPFYTRFFARLDNEWVDLFWQRDDSGRDYSARYFRFFYRYLLNKLFLEQMAGKRPQLFEPSEVAKSDDMADWQFLRREAPTQERTNTYLGFDVYKRMFERSPQLIEKIEKVLDRMVQPDFRAVLDEELAEPWDRTQRRNFFGLERDQDRLTGYGMAEMVAFAAVTEYIERSDPSAFDTENFRRWMRVVRNCIEGQLFQNVREVVSLSRNLAEVLKLPGATTDILAALASMQGRLSTREYPRSLREEVLKARIILLRGNRQAWEQAFVEAENHPFFRGAIGFLLYDVPAGADDFTRRASTVGQMFDKDGIVPSLRKGHVLLRSIVQRLNKRSLLFSSYPRVTLTERADEVRHLKSLMLDDSNSPARAEAIGRWLCALGDTGDLDVAVQRINTALSLPPNFELDSKEQEEDKPLVCAFRRLCVEPQLYDFIADVEARNSGYSVSFEADSGSYRLNRPRSWYDKIYIGHDRRKLVAAAVAMGYAHADPSLRKSETLRYGDIIGDDIWLSKELPAPAGNASAASASSAPSDTRLLFLVVRVNSTAELIIDPSDPAWAATMQNFENRCPLHERAMRLASLPSAPGTFRSALAVLESRL